MITPRRGGDTRTGLVLGGGGYRGGAWMVGVLRALQLEYGWEPGQAASIVGTSAGSMIGALAAGGVDLERIASGAVFTDAEGFEESGQDLDAATAPRRRHESRYWPTPGSWRLTWNCLRNPRRYPLPVLLSGLLPNGPFSTDPLREAIDQNSSGAWPRLPRLRVVACDYSSGGRVIFGPRDPLVPVGVAVAASCAVPAYYHPVSVDGHSYIDGGVCSPSNLDVVRRMHLDRVVCINPTSAANGAKLNGMAGRLMRLLRDASSRILEREAEKVSGAGIEVLLIEPDADEIQLMGLDLMRSDSLVAMVEEATTLFRKRLRKAKWSAQLGALGRSALPARSAA